MKAINSDIENAVGKNTPKILLSEEGRLIDIEIYCKIKDMLVNEKKILCFIIGTNPKGGVSPPIKYNDDCISLLSF